eukprot:15459645-Alexandrium_andersonii.AAC.1
MWGGPEAADAGLDVPWPSDTNSACNRNPRPAPASYQPVCCHTSRPGRAGEPKVAQSEVIEHWKGLRLCRASTSGHLMEQ